MRGVIWTPGMTLDTMIEMVITEAITFTKGNKAAVARMLDIAPRTLDNRMAKYEAARLEREKQAAEVLKLREDFLARQRGHTPPGATVSPVQ